MATAAIIHHPVFLALTTSEPNGEGEWVRVCARHSEDDKEVFDQLVRAPRLTLAQCRLAGVTNAELDRAPDLDSVLEDLLEFSEGADAWVAPAGIPARAAVRMAALSCGYPGRPGPAVIGLDELAAVVHPAISSRGMSDLRAHYFKDEAGRLEACGTVDLKVLRDLWARLNADLLRMPLPLLAEMNWLLAKNDHPLKKILKQAETLALKDQFSESMLSGKLALEKLFKDFSPIINRLKPDDESGEHVPDASAPKSPVSAEEIAKLFATDGPLAKGLQGYEGRPEQVEMAQRVGQALSEGKHLMAEAGTGVGKSLAYLAPAILFAKRAGRPVMISTHTKNLQSQLFQKDLPFLRKHAGFDFEASLLKGRPNYLCLRKFMYTLQESAHELEEEERAQMLPIMSWAVQTDDGDVSEMAAFAPEQNYQLWDRLHTIGDDCLKRQCPFYNRCFVYKARGKAHGADVVVLNHALVFSDLNLDSGALPDYNEIVFDEAHKLEDVATEHLASEITPRRTMKILGRLFRVPQGSSAGKGLLPTLLANVEQARSEFPEPLITSIREHILNAMQAVAPAGEGSDSLFSTVREWTENIGSASAGSEAPLQPYVPRERGRGGKVMDAFSDAPQDVWSDGTPVDNTRAAQQLPVPHRPAPFNKRPGSMSEDRRRFSAQTLRVDEIQAFEDGKEAAISRLGLLRISLEKLEEDFKEIRKRNVPRAREVTKEISAQNLFLQELIHDIEFVIKGEEPNYVFWSEKLGKRGARVVAAPLDVSALLHEQLYDKKRSIILASATLSVRDADAGDASGLMPMRKLPPLKPAGRSPLAPSGRGAGGEGLGTPVASGTPLTPNPSPQRGEGDRASGSPHKGAGDDSKPHPKSFEFLKHRLGLSLCDPEKLDELLLGSPFDYAEQCRLFIPTFIPEPGAREKDFNALFTAMVGELAITAGGRTMVLYTSYAALESSARILRKMLPPEGIEVLAQGSDGSREALLDRLRANGRSVLLGTASFWEGVDVRGEALSQLIIAKLPFAVFTDPIVQGRCELLEASGKDPFLHFSVPQAILKLRQGFGRLIRSKSDRGVVILADKRVLTKRYGAAFLRALPAQAQTMTSQDGLTSAVKRFLDAAR